MVHKLIKFVYNISSDHVNVFIIQSSRLNQVYSNYQTLINGFDRVRVRVNYPSLE